MQLLENIAKFLPEVKGPLQKRLSFKEKLKWTLIVLVLFFVLSLVPLYGLGQNSLQQFEFLSIILGASFGSIMSLGIGPLVTASIVLQLLKGTGILKMDVHTPEGRKQYQALQKVASIFFIIFEAAIYVFMGGLSPDQSLVGTSAYLQFQLILVFQLCLGGLMVMLMDEVCSKWGFGSGISLFIAAGVAQQIFIQAFNFLPAPNNPSGFASGKIPELFQALAAGETQTVALNLAEIAATIAVFAVSVYGQAMKVDIPLSFGRVRGYGIRWALNFFYTSNIPVILTAALMANIQLAATMLERIGRPWLGTFSGGSPVSGFVYWINAPPLVENLLRGSFVWQNLVQALNYILLMVIGAVLFSVFWVQTAGMDAKSQAKQILASGLQMPGFRRDERVMEKVLERYIWPLTIIGGASIGVLASFADLTGALSRGTGILLTVMIVYRLYEDIAKQHMEDMFPALRKFMQ